MKISRMLPMGLCTSALFFAALPGCSQESQPDPIINAAPATDPGIVRTDVYDGILGVITSMPVEGDPSSESKIHHEHIPAFKTKSGTINTNKNGTTGMNAMDMPFPPAEGLDLDGFAVGDKVRFSFAVNWGGRRAWEITKIEKLPEDAVIDYTPKPNAEVSAPDDHSGHGHDEEDHSGHIHGP